MNKECGHTGRLTISTMMAWPKLGVTSSVECADCHGVIGNCHWEQAIDRFAFELKFSPPDLQERVDKEEAENEMASATD